MKDEHRANPRGHITAFISNFLPNRVFHVQIGTDLSDVHEQGRAPQISMTDME